MRNTDVRTKLERFFTLHEDAKISTIRLTDDVLDLADDVEAISCFRDLLKEVERAPTQAILCITSPHSFSPERCDALWAHIGSLDTMQARSLFFPEPLSKVAVQRELSVFSYLIEWLRCVPKPVIMAFRGDVVFPFLGVGLACECRVATQETVFYNHYNEIGIPPVLGLLSLLPAYVGFGRANAMVLRTTKLSAKEALEWGLIDKAAPDSNIEEVAKTFALETTKCHPRTVSAVKRLMNHHLPDFSAFFMDERNEINRAIDGRPWRSLCDTDDSD